MALLDKPLTQDEVDSWRVPIPGGAVIMAPIDRAAEALGYARRDYLTKNYLTLYAEECRRKGVAPGNMLFSGARK